MAEVIAVLPAADRSRHRRLRRQTHPRRDLSRHAARSGIAGIARGIESRQGTGRADAPQRRNALTSAPFGSRLKVRFTHSGNSILFHPRAILMVLITIRLLMPPGICVCKLNSPAARFLVALLKSDKQVPNEEERDD